MDVLDIQRIGKCCACDRPFSGKHTKRINAVSLNRKCKWEFPRMGNVLTGSDYVAIAIVCDACISLNVPIKYAIEFKGDQIIYHAIEALEFINK